MELVTGNKLTQFHAMLCIAFATQYIFCATVVCLNLNVYKTFAMADEKSEMIKKDSHPHPTLTYYTHLVHSVGMIVYAYEYVCVFGYGAKRDATNEK